MGRAANGEVDRSQGSKERKDGALTMANRDTVAEEKVRAARARVAFLRPYFDSAIFALILVEAPGCPTLAVDQYKRLYYSPAFVHKHSVEQLVTMLLHELGHVLRDHLHRAKARGISDITRETFNVAADCELNDDLRKEVDERGDVPHLPDWTHHPSKIGQPEDQLWEVYYDYLMDHTTIITVKANADGSIDPGDLGKLPHPCEGDGPEGTSKHVIVVVEQDCGSGAHGVPRPWEHPAPDNCKTEGVSDADWRDIQRITAEKIANRHRSRGDVPGSWVEWSTELLRPKRIPWDQELAGGLRWALSDKSGMVFHSYKKPSRRQQAVPDVVFPSMRRPEPIVAMIGDTSGSMSETDLALVRGVVEDICQSMGAIVAFLATDAQVHGGIQKVQGGRKIELKGRGGTDMRVGIQYALDNLKPRPDVLVVATDCATPWPEYPPKGVRILVCAIGGDEESIASVPSWMRVIRVEAKG